MILKSNNFTHVNLNLIEKGQHPFVRVCVCVHVIIQFKLHMIRVTKNIMNLPTFFNQIVENQGIDNVYLTYYEMFTLQMAHLRGHNL